MKPTLTPLALALASALSISSAFADDCSLVHFTDPGWTDINATNAVASEVLKGLGYETKITTLAVPIGFEALKNAEVDVFLGNWMPAQQKFIEEYVDTGAIDHIRTNLTGAKFTLAVPDYVFEAGVESFADLAEHGDQFKQRIYGIESGAPANQLLQKMIDSGDFDLGDWKLVESGEQGVVSQVDREVRRDNFIVFLGWEPHPMNTNFDLRYLSGGDEYFGPDYGGATVHTLTRAGFTEACPNVGTFLNNLEFSLELENTVMGAILDEEMDADKAARQYLQAHPEVINNWLEGVSTVDGGDAVAAVKTSLGL